MGLLEEIQEKTSQNDWDYFNKKELIVEIQSQPKVTVHLLGALTFSEQERIVVSLAVFDKELEDVIVSQAFEECFYKHVKIYNDKNQEIDYLEFMKNRMKSHVKLKTIFLTYYITPLLSNPTDQADF